MDPKIIAIIAAALCIIMCAGAAMYSIKTCAPALSSVTSERPELGSKLLITIILGEALAIYGLLIAFMIIARIPDIETEYEAMQTLFASLTMGTTAIFASLGIAWTGPAMMSAAAERPESFTTNILGLVLSEALAIYGLLIAFMING
ncbi:MAG: ATP synthase subunit C [Candidatus Ranarchaeia archaeon]|jgi:F0F1-type ATP synthase membrane subunit c/vacuolar-type H+-ATPase subunit K